MKTRSFTTVVIRIIGMMSIVYGLMTALFIFVTLSMISGFPGEAMGSIIWMQMMLPIMMVVLGLVLIAASRTLGGALSVGLED